MSRWCATSTARAVSDARGLPDRLARQLDSPVRWVGLRPALVGLGADVLVEVGPGSVLSGLARRIAPEVRTARGQRPRGAARPTPAADRAGMNARPLAGKVALVTGASRGIGRASALALADAGAAVAVAYGASAAAADEVAALIREAGGAP